MLHFNCRTFLPESVGVCVWKLYRLCKGFDLICDLLVTNSAKKSDNFSGNCAHPAWYIYQKPWQSCYARVLMPILTAGIMYKYGGITILGERIWRSNYNTGSHGITQGTFCVDMEALQICQLIFSSLPHFINFSFPNFSPFSPQFSRSRRELSRYGNSQILVSRARGNSTANNTNENFPISSACNGADALPGARTSSFPYPEQMKVNIICSRARTWSGRKFHE